MIRIFLHDPGSIPFDFLLVDLQFRSRGQQFQSAGNDLFRERSGTEYIFPVQHPETGPVNLFHCSPGFRNGMVRTDPDLIRSHVRHPEADAFLQRCGAGDFRFDPVISLRQLVRQWKRDFEDAFPGREILPAVFLSR